MKKLFLSAFALVAMTACSKNEVMLDGTQKAIGFNEAQWNNSIVQRAATDLDQAVSLGVFAYQTQGAPSALYINDELSYQTDAWKLSRIYYWPQTNPELKFFAYGPKAQNNGITEASCPVGGTPAFTYEVTGAPGAQTDVIVDLAGQTLATGAVTFNLSHVLTQIQFKAQLSSTPNSTLDVKINSIKVQAPNSAKFANSSWSGHAATNTDYVVLDTETAVTATNGSGVSIGSSLNMIPLSTAAKIVVEATAYDKSTGVKVGDKTITINCDGITAPSVDVWAIGTQITYTLTLDPDSIASGSGSAIEFGQPTVNTWGPGSGNIGM